MLEKLLVFLCLVLGSAAIGSIVYDVRKMGDKELYAHLVVSVWAIQAQQQYCDCSNYID